MDYCYQIGIKNGDRFSFITADVDVYNKYNGEKRKSKASDMIGIETSYHWSYENKDKVQCTF